MSQILTTARGPKNFTTKS